MFDLLRQVAEAWRRAAASRELRALSDRDLADIGLRRSELDALARPPRAPAPPRRAARPVARPELVPCG